MKKIVIEITAFCLILLFSLSPVLLSGEILPTAFVPYVQGFLGENFLYGKAYSNDATYYKFNMIHQKQAEVLVTGTSRSLQIRDFFLNDDVSFYNAGSLSPTTTGLVTALPKIEKQALPKVLIISLDEYFFNTDWHIGATTAFHEDWLYIGDNITYNIAAKDMYADLIEGKLNLYDMFTNLDKIGVNAKVSGNGFDEYGCYIYGDVYENTKPDSERVEHILTDINEISGRYLPGDDIEQMALNDIKFISDFCDENGIELITFTPPLSQSGMSAINARDDMDYIYKIESAVSALAEECGFEFYHYTDPAILNIDDSYFVDGFHGSDSAYLLMMIDMLEKGSILNSYADINELHQLYENRISNLQVK